MPQGKMKQKVKIPNSIKKKEKHKKKPLGPKKGGKVIAPKKAKKVEQAMMQKNIEKVIKAGLEKEVTLKAKSHEAKPFTMVTPTSQ